MWADLSEVRGWEEGEWRVKKKQKLISWKKWTMLADNLHDTNSMIWYQCDTSGEPFGTEKKEQFEREINIAHSVAQWIDLFLLTAVWMYQRSSGW